MLFFGVAKGLDTKLKKTLRRSTLLPYVASTLSKCRPAAAEGAKLSTIRRGARTPSGVYWVASDRNLIDLTK